MPIWKIERLPDGELEVRYTDSAIKSASCGLCSAGTPVTLVLQWIVENGGDLDLVVDEQGGEFVKIPKVAARQ